MTIETARETEQTAHQASSARHVRYEVCASFLLATVRWQSAPVAATSAWGRVLRGVPYSAAALLLGPWGVPWGPIWTAVALWTNFNGGVADD